MVNSLALFLCSIVSSYSSRSFLIKLNLLILLEEKVVGSLKCLYLCIRYYELVA